MNKGLPLVTSTSSAGKDQAACAAHVCVSDVFVAEGIALPLLVCETGKLDSFKQISLNRGK